MKDEESEEEEEVTALGVGYLQAEGLAAPLPLPPHVPGLGKHRSKPVLFDSLNTSSL